MDATGLRRIYLVAFSILILTFFYYQILRGDYFARRALNNYLRVIPINSIRGSIFDRDGNVLAEDKPSFNIAVFPYQIRWIKDSLFEDIAKFLNINKDILNRNYKRNFKNLFSPVDILINLDKLQAIKLKERFGDNILINPQPTRYYFFPYETAHIIGYVKEAETVFLDAKKYGYSPKERVGVLGVEQYYNRYLSGEDGGYLIEVNANGKVEGFLGERRPKRGSDLFLTIDYRTQIIAHRLLTGFRGTIILMDVNSGEIITLVSSPSFDLNSFITGKNVANFLNDKDRPLINRAIQATYQPASTFKPILAAGALDDNLITPATTFVCKKVFNIGNNTFRCLSAHGRENLYEAIKHSCNIYFYNLGLKVGVERIVKYAKKFKLDTLTKIDLPYEKEGILPHQARYLKNWFVGDTVNLSIGQGPIEVSPIRLLTSINAIANNGNFVIPHILKKIEQKEVKFTSSQHLGLSTELLNIIKRSLVGVVEEEDGTAHLLNQLNLKIAGKTGTSQTKAKAHGWFVGFFPYYKPKYSICVFLENVGSSYEAVKLAYQFLEELIQEKILQIE